MRGRLTEKADVFGFGIVALEILSGRRNTDNSFEDKKKIYLLEWASIRKPCSFVLLIVLVSSKGHIIHDE